jgi:hypothetical protein
MTMNMSRLDLVKEHEDRKDDAPPKDEKEKEKSVKRC